MKNYKSIKKNIIKENGISISDFENSINKRLVRIIIFFQKQG